MSCRKSWKNRQRLWRKHSFIFSGISQNKKFLVTTIRFWPVLPLLLLGGCLGYPKGITPVRDFEVNRYLGTWYEIARLDHSFERGLQRVTAVYELGEDDGLKVINRGYSTEKEQWQEAEGRAYFVRSPDEGYLKVSFFGPFYASYVIFELDRKNYQYAWITSSDQSYLWFLSRTPQVEETILQRFRKRAKNLGYAIDELIYVDQE